MNLEDLESMNKILKEYQPIVISVVLAIVFLSAVEHFDNSLWHWIDAIVTILTVTGVWYNYHQNQKQRSLELQKIPIIFNIIDEDSKYQLNLDISRKEVSRSEIQGILSNYTTDPSERYKIHYLSEIKYLDSIYKIQNNDLNELVIDLQKKELKGYTEDNKSYVGFVLEKMRKI